MASRGATVHGLASERQFTQEEYSCIVQAKKDKMAHIGAEDMDEDLDEGDNDDGDLSPHDRNRGEAVSSTTQVAFADQDSFRTPPRGRGSRSRQVPPSQDTPANALPSNFELPDSVTAQIVEAVQAELGRSECLIDLKTLAIFADRSHTTLMKEKYQGKMTSPATQPS